MQEFFIREVARFVNPFVARDSVSRAGRPLLGSRLISLFLRIILRPRCFLPTPPGRVAASLRGAEGVCTRFQLPETAGISKRTDPGGAQRNDVNFHSESSAAGSLAQSRRARKNESRCKMEELFGRQRAAFTIILIILKA